MTATATVRKTNRKRYDGPIEEGQHWAFIGKTGSRREYVIEKTGQPVEAIDGIATIRNLDNDGLGHVTHRWLRGPGLPDDAYFELIDRA